MHFNDPPLEYIFTAKLLQHLRLCCMHHVAEVHIVAHRPLGILSPIRESAWPFTGGERERNGTESASKATPLDMRVCESPPIMAQSSP